MAADWKALCRANDLRVSGDEVEAVFAASERKQVLRVEEQETSFLLSTVVAKPSALRELDEPALLAWRRNRSTKLCGFRIDRRGRLIGEAWIPKVGITADEFQLYARTLAVEADRLEFLLTGTDVE